MQLNLLLREDKGKLEEAGYAQLICYGFVHLNSFYQHSNIFTMTSHQDIKLPLYISNQRLRKKTPFLHRISWIWLQSPLPESYGAWCIFAY
jgi:hypothetical protein